MNSPSADTRFEDLAPQVESLLNEVRTLRDDESEETERPERSLGELRGDLLLLLRLKVLPELKNARKLPVFVAVQGGTNVGKSTVFNTLAGQLLSPSVVQASATKHPLVYVHQSWKDALLAGDTFPGLELRELEDPKELLVDEAATELVYLRFHDDAELSPFALVDSPDFDSALDS
ncbi:MAG: GTPase, partial [Planctomycetota bacterium]